MWCAIASPSPAFFHLYLTYSGPESASGLEHSTWLSVKRSYIGKEAVLGLGLCCLNLQLFTWVKLLLTATGQLGQNWPIFATLQGAFSRPSQSQLELIFPTAGFVASAATTTLQAHSARTAQSCGKHKLTRLNAVAGSPIPMPACSCREPYSHACFEPYSHACSCREPYSHACSCRDSQTIATAPREAHSIYATACSSSPPKVR